MPFAKGQSGNPAGRPPGSRNRTTLFMEALLAAQAEEVTCKAIAKAREGDASALRLCFERLLPRGNDRPVPFALPVVETAADARTAISRIIAATGAGELTPPQALSLMRVVEKGAQIIVATEVAEKARDATWRREQMEFWSEPEQRREREERRDGERREKAAREAAEREMVEREQAAREDWARRVSAAIIVDDDDTAGGAGGADEPSDGSGGASAGPAGRRRRTRGSAGGGGRRRAAAAQGRGRAGGKAGRGRKAKAGQKSRRTGAGAKRAAAVDSAGVAPTQAAATTANNNARGNNETTMQRATPAVAAPLLKPAATIRDRVLQRIALTALAGAAPSALVPATAGRVGSRLNSWLAAILHPVALARGALAGGGAVAGPLPALP